MKHQRRVRLSNVMRRKFDWYKDINRSCSNSTPSFVAIWNERGFQSRYPFPLLAQAWLSKISPLALCFHIENYLPYLHDGRPVDMVFGLTGMTISHSESIKLESQGRRKALLLECRLPETDTGV
ncbi:Hypothetical predicted protein [Olea europaea subsp. europaea]|uniref:Uncharacterized protein n=1 Tax=Olea europaea subsp. europaea TaxID=158383 RepID=A0A8S0TYD6_OLEEU|nr:Hypothetical predicted protein [Olea europaea subsp. europaea]